MTAGERVIAEALKYEGVHEIPWGSNDDEGGPITQWQKAVGLYGFPADKKPWCGTFEKAMFVATGVDDSGLCSPSTQLICERADALGGMAPAGLAPPGTIIVACAIHTGLVVHDRGNGLLDTIEGNVSDSVKREVRDRADWRLIVAPAIAADGAPPQPLLVPSYGFDDLSLKPTLYGGWTTAQKRTERRRDYEAAHPGDWTREVRTSASSPYAFWAGPRGTYGRDWKFGGWPNEHARDEIRDSYLEEHPDARIRIWRRVVPVPAGTGGASGIGAESTT